MVIERTRTTRILMVEDNPFDVEMTRMALDSVKDWPIEITVAQDGEIAIRLLQDRSQNVDDVPDLILLDLNIPKRDGTEVLHAIRKLQRFSGLPVAILSSSPGDVIQKKLIAAGVKADGHFTKPFGFDEFLQFGHVLRDWYEKHIVHTD